MTARADLPVEWRQLISVFEQRQLSAYAEADRLRLIGQTMMEAASAVESAAARAVQAQLAQPEQPADLFEEWSCQRMDDRGWHNVGPEGDKTTAEREMHEWAENYPDAPVRVARRRYTAWEPTG